MIGETLAVAGVMLGEHVARKPEHKQPADGYSGPSSVGYERR